MKWGISMKYIGSKNRLSKELAPIIQGYITEDTVGYLEPFVGGANMIDKIQCNNKIGCDIHEELIELLKYIQNTNNILPTTIKEEEYNKVRLNKDKYEKWYVGFIGFCATFGAKYFGGYARGFKEDKITPRDMAVEGIRNIEKQRKNLQNIKFKCCSYDEINKNIKDFVIYCDPPYKGTLKYTTDFDYDKFYKWCKEMSKNNIILISEYWMPEEFECIWEKKTTVRIDSNKKSKDKKMERIEKLFIYRGDDIEK